MEAMVVTPKKTAKAKTRETLNFYLYILPWVLGFSIFTIIPLVIGITRVYFNVHYASDVVCGWCLGAIVAILMTEVIKPGLTNFSKLKKGA